MSVSSEDGGNNETEIADDLEGANGTVEVVVRLEETAMPETVTDEQAAIELLEAHANTTQDDLLTYANETSGLDVTETFWVTNAVLLEVDTDEVRLETVAAFDRVTEVHRNVDIPVPEPAPENESEPDLAEQTRLTTGGIAMLGVPAVWDRYDTQGEGVRVAVLDTGVDASHPDIDLYTDDPDDPTYPGGWAAFDRTGTKIPDSTPSDSDIHGTHVSGTVAGGDAAGGYIGVAPDVELLHGQVITAQGGSFAQILAGIEWALEAESDVINLSLGTTGYVDELIDPLQNAEDSGVIVVTAVGNEGHGSSGSPANIYETVSVGAVDATGAVTSFSGGETISRSSWQEPPATWPEEYIVPDVVAPGVGVYSAVPGGGYEQLPGTSMATPHVAGTAALLLSIEPDATPEEIRATLYETAWRPDGDGGLEKDERYGYGIVDAAGAADAIAGTDSEDAVTERDQTGVPVDASDELKDESVERDDREDEPTERADETDSEIGEQQQTDDTLEATPQTEVEPWLSPTRVGGGVLVSLAALVLATLVLLARRRVS